MNRFSHEDQVLNHQHNTPEMAMPDWLSLVDRKVHIRSQRVNLYPGYDTAEEQSRAEDILPHLQDEEAKSSGKLNRCSQFRQEFCCCS